jgi:hypothetical protein
MTKRKHASIKKQKKLTKKSKKIGVKKLVNKVLQKREKDEGMLLKKRIMATLKHDPELYKKLATQGSVSAIVDSLIPLGKEMIQHPEVIDEITHNEVLKKEILDNPEVVAQLLQIPEVADNAAREPSLIVEILKDASKVRTLTKSLSRSSTHTNIDMLPEELDHVDDVIVQEKQKIRVITVKNCAWAALLVTMGIVLTLGPGRQLINDAMPMAMHIKDNVVKNYVYLKDAAQDVAAAANFFGQRHQPPPSNQPMRIPQLPGNQMVVYQPPTIERKQEVYDEEGLRFAYELQGIPHHQEIPIRTPRPKPYVKNLDYPMNDMSRARKRDINLGKMVVYEPFGRREENQPRIGSREEVIHDRQGMRLAQELQGRHQRTSRRKVARAPSNQPMRRPPPPGFQY